MLLLQSIPDVKGSILQPHASSSSWFVLESYSDGSDQIIQNIVQHMLVLSVFFLKFFKCLHTDTHSSHVTNENFSLASVYAS